jgi:arabinofuranosyltransferase
MPLDPHEAPIERARALRIGLVCALVWALHSASFWPFFTDDAFITLRYAQRWLEHGELSWNAGERVEGYSNPLWLLGCAALGAAGFELVLAARVLGALCAVLTLAALLHAFPPRVGEPRLRAWIAPLSAALAGPIAAWTLAGLEEPLVLALLACALAPLLRLAREPRARDAWIAGAPLALACLTRPDGALYTALACGSLLAIHGARTGLRFGLRLAALPIAASALLTCARLAYYGAWLPNTAHAKAAVDGESLRWGLAHYALPALLPLSAWIALAALGLWGAARVRALRPGTLVLASCAFGWSAYAIAIGGDDFSAWRHHCPSLLLAGCLAAHSAGAWPRRAPAHPTAEASAAGQLGARAARLHHIACALALGLLPLAQLADVAQHRARGERWVWHGLEMGEFFAHAFAHEQPLLAIDAAGCLPYASRLPCLDMLGLNDSHIARQPPRPGTRFRPGHMRGDVDYVLDRAPDLLVFGTPPGFPLQAFDAGGSFLHEPRFRADYRLASFACGPNVPLARVWVRLAGRAGVAREPAARDQSSRDRESQPRPSLRIPAYLLGSIDAELAIAAGGLSAVEHVLAAPPALGMLDARARASARLLPNVWAELGGFELEPGLWRAHSEPTELPLRWRVGATELAPGSDFEWPGGPCSLGVLAPAEPVELRALVLVRERP